jgi:hypothetical protein
MSEKPPPSLVELMLRVAERFGVPVVLLGVVLWLLRDAAVVLHGTVVVPIVKSHAEFLEGTRETLTEIGKTQQQQAATMQTIAETQREIKQAVINGKPGNLGIN